MLGNFRFKLGEIFGGTKFDILLILGNQREIV